MAGASLRERRSQFNGIRAAHGRHWERQSQFNGITKDEISLKMKNCFQIFGDILAFVGWLAPAYGDRRSQFNGIRAAHGRHWERQSQFNGITYNQQQ